MAFLKFLFQVDGRKRDGNNGHVPDELYIVPSYAIKRGVVCVCVDKFTADTLEVRIPGLNIYQR